jgi:hypothetical protein
MKITLGVIFLLMGSLLATIGFGVPSLNHIALGLTDVISIFFLWLFSILFAVFHESIFRKDRILLIVMPVLLLGFIWLVLNIGYLLSFGIQEFNLYIILLGWCFFNSGLYLDTREILKVSKK